MASTLDDARPVLIDELADLIGTSVRTIKRRLRLRAFPIPELDSIDKTHRWSRRVVREWLDQRDRNSMAPRLQRVG